MRKEDINRFKVKAESLTESFLVWRVGLPVPFTFAFEAVLWCLAAFGVWKLFM